jgi:hypothetical protein
MHEIHRPDSVDGIGHSQHIRLFPCQTLLGFDAQIQFQLTIDTVDALVIPAIAFHVMQVQKAQAKAPVTLVVGQPYQPVGNFFVLG